MSAYRKAYQQFKQDSQSQNLTPPPSFNTFRNFPYPFDGGQQLPDGPFTGPAANNSSSSDQTIAVDYDQSIVGAVIAVKTASAAAAREAALRTLTEIVGIEFDAHRNLKASELESLRQRLEEIEKAEAQKVENRAELLKERVQRLLGENDVRYRSGSLVNITVHLLCHLRSGHLEPAP